MILNDREMEETDALYNKKKTKIKLKKRISLVGSLVIILVVILWGIRRIFYDINSVYDVYLTTSQYESWIYYISTKNFDESIINVQTENIGSTFLGHNITGLTLTTLTNKVEFQPQNTLRIGIDCGIHAREWISPAICRLLIHELTKCSINSTSRSCSWFTSKSFFDVDWFIIPMVNWDGYAYSWDSNNRWRKNRSPSPFPNISKCVGTDLNRNCDIGIGNNFFGSVNDTQCP